MDIKQSIADVITYAYKIEHPNIDRLYHQWQIHKKHFIERMNGQLIYESKEPVTFTLTHEEKRNQYMTFYHLQREAETALSYFLDALEIEDFYNNITSKQYDVVTPSGVITVPKGWKVLKSFKLFVEEEEQLKTLQQEASAIIQRNCATGHLCISVHPLDYLSISENTLNWRSCHSLNGDFAAGNLEYIADKATVVCYLKSDKNAILPDFPEHIPWNNKKWRCLLFFDDNLEFVMASKQYPFESSGALPAITELLRDCGFGLWTKWYNSYVDHLHGEGTDKIEFYMENLLPIGDCLIPLNKVINMSRGHSFYCDLTQSSSYEHPYYAYNITDCNPFSQTGWTAPGKTKINIGETICCPKCGYERRHSTCDIVCDFCISGRRFEKCDLCQKIVPSGYRTDDGYLLCKECYETRTIECARCFMIVRSQDAFFHSEH